MRLVDVVVGRDIAELVHPIIGCRDEEVPGQQGGHAEYGESNADQLVLVFGGFRSLKQTVARAGLVASGESITLIVDAFIGVSVHVDVSQVGGSALSSAILTLCRVVGDSFAWYATGLAASIASVAAS